MKRMLIILSITTGLVLFACGTENSGHSHNGSTGQSHEHTHQGGDGSTNTMNEDSPDQHQHNETDHQPSDTSADQDPGNTTDEERWEGSGAVTQWTDKTELFMEYPEIIVGEQATFAVHLTRLSDFQPLSNSEVRFFLRSDQGATLSVTEAEVQVPGIYGPDFVFEEPGRYDLTIEIRGMVNDTLHVHEIPVYNSVKDIPDIPAEEDPNLITFLKEQQWNIPFGTKPVTHRTLTRILQVPGEIMTAQNSHAMISAPFAGIILPSMNRNLPVEGQHVTQGRSVAVLNPAVQSGNGDNYAQQYINAHSELQLAETNLQRSQRLIEKKAIPETELQKARLEYRKALTRFRTINELIQIDTSSAGEDGRFMDSYRFELKAPISGTVTTSHVTPGMQVQAGQALFSLADANTVWLKAYVPVALQNEIGNANDAAFTIQGSDSMYIVSELGGRLLSRGNTVEPGSRTITLIYELQNAGNRLPLGMFSTVHIHTDTHTDALAVPVSALIEEEGTYFVYVHVSGESFEKRRISTGIRDRGWVEVTSGLQEGEHVVTTNAYQVKLASLSSEAPAHGHAH